MPRGVEDRHWVGSSIGLLSEARMRGVVRRLERTLLLEVVGAMLLKAEVVPMRPPTRARNVASFIMVQLLVEMFAIDLQCFALLALAFFTPIVIASGSLTVMSQTRV